VHDKNRIGDWEIDIIIGRNNKNVIVTVIHGFFKKAIYQKF
jgi:IS30 family transposase